MPILRVSSWAEAVTQQAWAGAGRPNIMDFISKLENFARSKGDMDE
jgi:hypothetical protein